MADQRDDESESPAEVKNLMDAATEVEGADQNLPPEDSKDIDTCVENQMPSHKQEEEIIKKKYGGLLQKKPPLISKDNERAFFDSADWALGKKSKGPLIEALRPKLQPSPHHQARARSPCAPADDVEGDNITDADNDGLNCDGLKHGLSSDDQIQQG